ncbi:hypothetical protein C0995_003086 [Termitomyces sp. Mi166|nr:hypothetical protein C0995_003086 [Termitomyces sp. Mi166\
MRFQISALLPLFFTTTVIALPFQSSSLSSRVFTAAEEAQCPSMRRLVEEARVFPVTNGLYWTSDAGPCYAKYGEKHKLTSLRHLWDNGLINIWNKNADCFKYLSQAFTLSTEGEVVVVSAPVDTEEKGSHRSLYDGYWPQNELPILTDPKKGHRMTKITRVNLKKVKSGPHMCEEISTEVTWKEGDPVFHPPPPPPTQTS